MDKQTTQLHRLFEANAFPDDAFFIHKALAGRRLIVYGAGESFHYFREVVMRTYGYRPELVLDRRFKAEDRYEGIPARSPEGYQPSHGEQEEGVVVVCLGQQSYLQDVMDDLRQLGFQHLLRLMDIYEIHNPFQVPRALIDQGFPFYLDRKEGILAGLELFQDEWSREVYVRCLQTHMERRPVAIPMSQRQEQYTTKDVPWSRGYSRLIYCGASVGEMARVLDEVGPVEELVCFEPDPNQYRLVADYLSQHHAQVGRRVTVLPCAVHNREAVAPFTHSDTSFGSRVVESGHACVQCVSLDRALPGFAPTFVCMDIEGAELEALRGAEKTIRDSRPDLAICVYHAPDHLWEIPLYLHRLGLGYRLYLRNYTSLTYETVLYATVEAPA